MGDIADMHAEQYHEEYLKDLARWEANKRRARIIKKIQEAKEKNMEGIYPFHHTSGNKTYFIEEMEDSHLFNTMNVLLENLAKAKAVMNGKDVGGWYRKVQPSRLSSDQADEFFEFFMERYPYYLLEATIRGMDVAKLNQKLKAIMEREEKLDIEDPIRANDQIYIDIIEG